MLYTFTDTDSTFYLINTLIYLKYNFKDVTLVLITFMNPHENTTEHSN